MTRLPPGETFAIDERDDDGVCVIAAAGELDLATAPRLVVQLDAARRGDARALIVDLTALEFCDSTGLRALIGAHGESRAARRRFAVVCRPGSGVARLFDVAGASESLPLYPELESALAAVAPVRSGA
jgi:anti-anti-sigma factor